MFLRKLWNPMIIMVIWCLWINSWERMHVNARGISSPRTKNTAIENEKHCSRHLAEVENSMRQKYLDGLVKVKGKMLDNVHTLLIDDEDCPEGTTEKLTTKCESGTIDTTTKPTSEIASKKDECKNSTEVALVTTTHAPDSESGVDTSPIQETASGVVSFKLYLKPDQGRENDRDSEGLDNIDLKKSGRKKVEDLENYTNKSDDKKKGSLTVFNMRDGKHKRNGILINPVLHTQCRRHRRLFGNNNKFRRHRRFKKRNHVGQTYINPNQQILW